MNYQGITKKVLTGAVIGLTIASAALAGCASDSNGGYDHTQGFGLIIDSSIRCEFGVVYPSVDSLGNVAAQINSVDCRCLGGSCKYDPDSFEIGLDKCFNEYPTFSVKDSIKTDASGIECSVPREGAVKCNAVVGKITQKQAESFQEGCLVGLHEAKRASQEVEKYRNEGFTRCFVAHKELSSKSSSSVNYELISCVLNEKDFKCSVNGDKSMEPIANAFIEGCMVGRQSARKN